MGRLHNRHAHDKKVEDYFGDSVSLYGNTALIGASGDDDNGSLVLDPCTCLLVRALMGILRNNLNSTRAIRQLTIISVVPFLYTATRR